MAKAVFALTLFSFLSLTPYQLLRFLADLSHLLKYKEIKSIFLVV